FRHGRIRGARNGAARRMGQWTRARRLYAETQVRQGSRGSGTGMDAVLGDNATTACRLYLVRASAERNRQYRRASRPRPRPGTFSDERVGNARGGKGRVWTADSGDLETGSVFGRGRVVRARERGQSCVKGGIGERARRAFSHQD